MDERQISLFVFFEAPFWVGVFERTDSGRLQAAKIVFGAEPTDAEVLERIGSGWQQLRFSPAVEARERRAADNPKRRQRAAARARRAHGASTRAQAALSRAREAGAQEKREAAKARRRRQAQQQFERKQAKRKEKHRGH